jgi:Zn-dependent membrane protease YugP
MWTRPVINKFVAAGLLAAALAAAPAARADTGIVPPEVGEDGSLSWDVPPRYQMMTGSVVVVVATALVNLGCDWAALFVIWFFGFFRRGVVAGRDLAPRLLSAAAETSVRVDETFHNMNYRRIEGETDWRPKAGVIELTADKAGRATAASAGLVAVEVGRALQDRRGYPPVAVERRLGPFANVAGHIWIFPFFAAAVIGSIFRTGWSTPVADTLWGLGGGMIGLLFLYAAVRAVLDVDAARRGMAAVRSSQTLAPAAADRVRVFLVILLALSVIGLVVTALNIFRPTARGSRG